jgi:hypothetical protein
MTTKNHLINYLSSTEEPWEIIAGDKMIMEQFEEAIPSKHGCEYNDDAGVPLSNTTKEEC